MLVLCIIVFLCRIVDVSLATVRTVVTVKGMTWLASLFGFFEVFIWFMVVQKALGSANGSIYVAIAYAGGYATGTLVGSLIAKAFVPSKIEVQVVTSSKNVDLLLALREHNFAATVIEATGAFDKEPKYMIYINTTNKLVKNLQKIILEHDAKAFITMNEATKFVNGYFANRK